MQRWMWFRRFRSEAPDLQIPIVIVPETLVHGCINSVSWLQPTLASVSLASVSEGRSHNGDAQHFKSEGGVYGSDLNAVD